MSDEGLRETVSCTLGFEQQVLIAQQRDAQLLGHLSLNLANLYREQQKDLDNLMKKEPKTSTHSSKTFGVAVQKWQVEYNNENQKWQNEEAQWNATVQSTNQELQTVGNTAQQTSQSATYCTQALNCTARLLQSQLS